MYLCACECFGLLNRCACKMLSIVEKILKRQRKMLFVMERRKATLLFLLLGVAILLIYFTLEMQMISVFKEKKPLTTSYSNLVENFDLFAAKYSAKFQRPLPDRMRQWYDFALANNCDLYHYDHIEKYLQPFRVKGGLDSSILKLTEDSFHKDLLTLIRIRNGTSTSKLPRNLKNIVAILPDTDFFINGYDEPRVFRCNSIFKDCARNARTYSHSEKFRKACQYPKKQLEQYMNSHGAFMYETPTTFNKIPVFSPTRINECHQDILIPYYNGFNMWKPSDSTYLPWENKINEVFWRGSSTGIYITAALPWRKTQRFNLVRKFGRSINKFLNTTPAVKLNIGFTAILQADHTQYGMAEHEFGPILPRVPFADNFKRKFIIDIDGNSFSARFTALLRSNSLIFKASIYEVWYSDLFKPWVHYVPIDITLNDLPEKIQWALDNDEEAKQIAENSARFASSRLRDIDMDCYTARLIIEYASLFR